MRGDMRAYAGAGRPIIEGAEPFRLSQARQGPYRVAGTRIKISGSPECHCAIWIERDRLVDQGNTAAEIAAWQGRQSTDNDENLGVFAIQRQCSPCQIEHIRNRGIGAIDPALPAGKVSQRAIAPFAVACNKRLISVETCRSDFAR
jgi:hypothetical protein